MSIYLVKCLMTKDSFSLLQSKKILIYCVKNFHGRNKIGTREVVGYGVNGAYEYYDIQSFPCPAIRFREETPEIRALREKEKGDWKNLTIEEKKACKLTIS